MGTSAKQGMSANQSSIIMWSRNRMQSFTLCLLSYFFAAVPVAFCFFDSSDTFAVGGISNSKVVVPSAETVEKGRFEIEPFFGLILLDDSDDTVQFDGGVRFTLGALDNLEVGTNVGYLTLEDSDLTDRDSNFGDIEAGLKYRFLDEDENFLFSLAYQGGVTFPTSGDGAPWIFELGGLILTKNFTEEFSMDADFVVALIEDESVSFVSEVGFGYFVHPWFQPVVELAYFCENPDDDDNVSILTLTAGFTAPVGEMLTIIIGVSPDIYTDNTDKAVVLSAAFTFLF